MLFLFSNCGPFTKKCNSFCKFPLIIEGVTDEIWMVLQNVDPSSRHPTDRPSPSISVLSYEGHRVVDTLRSFALIGKPSPSSVKSSIDPSNPEGGLEEVSEEKKLFGHSPPEERTSTAIRHVIRVQNNVWLADSAGYIHVYCALSYQPLLSFPVFNSNSAIRKISLSMPFAPSCSSSPTAYALQLLFVPAANQVFASLSDGSLVFCNVSAVAQHLPAIPEESVSVDHKWLPQTLMQVTQFIHLFLDAFSHLYMRVCPSVSK